MLYPTLLSLLKSAPEALGEKQYLISEGLLKQIVSAALSSVVVDDTWYSKNNTDVKEAVGKGKIKSGTQHFIEFGYFENRLPRYIEIDEEFYLNNNSDVALAVKQNVFENGQQHFDFAGSKEGRLPRPGFSLFEQPEQRVVNSRRNLFKIR